MIKLSALLLSTMFACQLAHAAAPAAPACNADVADEVPLSDRYQYKVAGKGRLYFHTVPNEQCASKKVFVVPGDSLTAYSEAGKNGEWTSVMYMAKDGEDYSAWVRTERLQFMGAFGMQMSPEKIKFYEKAAKAAEAGKLGSP